MLYAVVDLFCPLHTILLKIIYIVKQLIRIKPSEEYSALKLENSEIWEAEWFAANSKIDDF